MRIEIGPFLPCNELIKCFIFSSIIAVSYNDLNLHVGGIPGTVTSDRLQQLFPQATSIDYRQGKITRDRVKSGYEMDRNDTHRFLSFLFRQY